MATAAAGQSLRRRLGAELRSLGPSVWLRGASEPEALVEKSSRGGDGGQLNTGDALLASPRAYLPERSVVGFLRAGGRGRLQSESTLTLTINCYCKSVPGRLSQSREMTWRYNPLGVLHTSRIASYMSQPSIIT